MLPRCSLLLTKASYHHLYDCKNTKSGSPRSAPCSRAAPGLRPPGTTTWPRGARWTGTGNLRLVPGSAARSWRCGDAASHKCRGEAPKGAGAERRTSWPALRSGRSADRRRPPANDAGRRAFRRFTAAFARQRHVTRRSSSGPRFLGPFQSQFQRAPRGRVVVPGGRSPGAAREQGYKSRPQGPHPAPPSVCLRKTPLGGQDEHRIIYLRKKSRRLFR